MRRYFPNLLLNDETKKRLGVCVTNRTLPHAILICGPSGSGKMTLTLELAAALNCENMDEESLSLPCCECSSCKRIYDGNFPDVKFLKRQKDRATIGVEAVKTFREDMFLSSTESDCKIYVIEDAHTMTPEAQNSLLKILEEPPKGVVLILLSEEADKILTTIKSRVQYIAMARFDEEVLREELLRRSETAKKLQFEDREKFYGAIVSADGRLGLALDLVSRKAADENDKTRKEIIDFINATAERGGYAHLLEAINSLPRARGELMQSLEGIITAVRDLITVKTAEGAKLLFYTSYDGARTVADKISLKRLLKINDALLSSHELCYRNANVQNVLANLSSKIKNG